MAAILITIKALKAILEKCWVFFTTLIPWSAVFAAFMSLVAAFDANYTALLTGINNLAGYMHGQPAATFLAQANRIFPISEAISMALVLLTLRVTAMLIRFIKSFLPTIN